MYIDALKEYITARNDSKIKMEILTMELFTLLMIRSNIKTS